MSKLFTLPSIRATKLEPFFASDGNEHGDFEPMSIPSLTSIPRVVRLSGDRAIR